jgi:telomerase reverse transcriptase
MADLKADMFEEVRLDEALAVLQSRRLGFSQVRLLPKGDKLRPIMNLRRRALTRGASKTLGPSINTILGPVHTLLKLERVSKASTTPEPRLTTDCRTPIPRN